jgi:hypothetical protein
VLNVFDSQQAAVGWSQAMCQCVIIYVNLYAHLFTLKDWVSSTIMSVYLCFIMLNMFNSQQAVIGRSQAARWHSIIYVNPYAHFFMLKDQVSSVIVSVRQFANFGKVIFPVHLQQNPSIMVNVMNSYLTLDKVNLTIMFNIIICYLALDWVNLTIPPDAMMCYLTLGGVNWTIVPGA